jgi:hypothetical protein
VPCSRYRELKVPFRGPSHPFHDRDVGPRRLPPELGRQATERSPFDQEGFEAPGRFGGFLPFAFGSARLKAR